MKNVIFVKAIFIRNQYFLMLSFQQYVINRFYILFCHRKSRLSTFNVSFAQWRYSKQ